MSDNAYPYIIYKDVIHLDAMAIPITEHESVQSIFALYQQNGMTQEKSDVESLFKHIEFMETQFDKVFDELQNVRSQLDALQDKGVKASVTRIVDTVGVKVSEAKTQFISIKDGVLRSLSNTVESVKEKGVSALSKTLDFLKVHSALGFLKTKLDGAVQALGRGIEQIENVKTELHAAKSHARSAGRLMLGKEVKEAAYNPNRGILAAIQKGLGKTEILLFNIGKVAESAMRKVEGLSKADEKNSVKQSLREIKSTRSDGKSSKPERDTAR